MNLEGMKVTLHDMSLRDGMHPQRHQLTPEQMVQVATALDEAVRDGRIQHGQTVLVDAFGAGLTAGGFLFRW